MNCTNEQLAKVKAAKSAEELLALAKAEGVALTEEEAKKYFAELRKGGEIADDELAGVAGGGCGDPDPKYPKGSYVTYFCSNGWAEHWVVLGMEYKDDEWYYQLECNGYTTEAQESRISGPYNIFNF